MHKTAADFLQNENNKNDNNTNNSNSWTQNTQKSTGQFKKIIILFCEYYDYTNVYIVLTKQICI